MIVTLTPNPSLDRALELDRLEVGEVNRADRAHVHPGGKGINVSRVLVRHGVPTLAVLPTGGADGSPADRLRTAVAFGRAAVLLPGTAVPGPPDLDLDAVRVVENPDPRLALKEL